MVTLPVHAYQLTLVWIRNVAIDDAPVSFARAHLLWELRECIGRLLAYLWIITVPLVARECEYEQEEIVDRRKKWDKINKSKIAMDEPRRELTVLR